ncbi:methyl-accepting chemotaxis protein [Belnapia sp. F-4-1]|uniref:methyl-accepting chemotaxis protein n=1 Tax=Belnapia sp. F-4-1 TaxID=1545443 RepID=UPI00068F11CA|nr:HAMP domain-containing methyl-accepting chemotaxis protein [Belnapia sp. F-4-1]
MLNAFRHARLSLKVMLPLAVMASVALGAGAFVSRSLVTLDAAYASLLARESQGATHATRVNVTIVDMPRALWRAFAVPEAVNIAQSAKDLEAIGSTFAERAAALRAAVAGTPHAATLAGIEREFEALHATGLRGIAMLQAGRGAEAMALLRTEFFTQITKLREESREMTASLLASAAAKSAALRDEAQSTIWTAVTVLGTGILLSLGLGLWMARLTVIQPFARLQGAMQRLAGGDLATPIDDADRRDEIGSMARALQGFATSLQQAETLRAGQEAAKQRAEEERKAGLASLASSLETSIGGVTEHIASAAAELNAAATSKVAIADGTSERAGTVSGATQEASGNVNTVAAATEELAASVAEISRQVAESARMAASAADQANRTDATVANLNEAAARIGEVTRLIDSIAGQTNLLALNATIEAARAGEAGKGFAVVASEVKALANQTAQATGNIAAQIQSMQAATRQATTDIGVIRDSIGAINEVTAAIAAAVEEQGAATRDIAQNVQQAAAGTAAIAGAIDGVTAAAGETGGAASQVQATSATLAEQAETLRRALGETLGRLRAA